MDSSYSSPLTDFARIGPVVTVLMLVLLAAGIVFFCMSFTNRYGRSRWPLHALMATAIASIGFGVALPGKGMAAFMATLAISGGNDPSGFAVAVSETLIGAFWFGFVGGLLGLLAGIRAIIGIVREPGPRF